MTWIDALLAEYEACNEGYDSRDTIVSHEFASLILVFTGLVVSIWYVTDNLKPNGPSETALVVDIFLFLFYIAILLFGVSWILGISLDLQSTHSAKVSIRNRIIEIENEINYENLLNIEDTKSMHLWSRTIKKRHKYDMEDMFDINVESEIKFMIDAMYLLISAYFIIVISYIYIYCSRIFSIAPIDIIIIILIPNALLICDYMKYFVFYIKYQICMLKLRR